MRTEYRNDPTMDPSGFVLLADYVPHIVQESGSTAMRSPALCCPLRPRAH